MTQIHSPLTGNTDVKLIQSLDVRRIEAQYLADVNVDVRRFFTGLAEVKIYECQTSGLRFYHPFTLAGDGEFYARLSASYQGYYSPWKWEHEVVYGHVAKGMDVLEIGCGNGYFLQKLQQNGCRPVGLELNEKAVEYGRQHGLPILNESLAVHAAANPGKYDMVCAFQVFEHVTEVRQMLEQAVACLKKGGILAIGVPNNDAYIFKKDLYHTLNLPPHHTLLWSPGSLGYLPRLFDLQTIGILTEPAHKIHKSATYRLFLRNLLKSKPLADAIHALSRVVVKNLPVFNDGAAVVGMFRKG